jgi:2-polyprenyl-3-methyl-5-hydroxy-6-metoxy-1,4-benzoquinol methylase
MNSTSDSDNSDPDKRRVADHWSDKAKNEANFSSDVYWMANPAVFSRFQRKASRGQDHGTWPVYCLANFLTDRLPVERMLSLGCGSGILERGLAAHKAFLSCDAFDIAPLAIEDAKRLAAEAKLDTIHYATVDIETEVLPERAYDAVWFNSSLHHIDRLEFVLTNVAQSLKPDGYLFVNEYVGPNRFRLSERERTVLQSVFQLIPEKYRRLCGAERTGEVSREVFMPDPADVVALDPSESIRSADIQTVLPEFFELLETNDCGGTILHFLLQNIAGNFRDENPGSMEVLRMLFAIEDTLIGVHDIQPHFVMIIAKPLSARSNG